MKFNFISYYLIDKSNYEISSTQGTLFYCSEENKACDEINKIGYYVVDKNTIYTCKLDNVNGFYCIKENLTKDDNQCDEQHIGKLYSKNSSDIISLCLNYDDDTSSLQPEAISVDLTNNNISENYIIKKNSDNIFNLDEGENYALINIKNKVITLNPNYKNGLKNVYIDKSTYKVVEKSETVNLEPRNILEINCVNAKCSDN
ncbi:hypothetical protein LY90DRAFT_509679 [Neocallimastix californiae]|uniref:Uncharacterized protein n=1 Tax=Neocallimastix californiae TaxID=1754190 RepID=A0A1Y2CB38_9FUNG|nr:hypothetical protein LY90DRAFT_509679 [Neocallimastix californiae]|eukprot:ORY44243.1 hypothetical protein LY90DRAFT_509679 [Neocallimastix californiae]